MTFKKGEKSKNWNGFKKGNHPKTEFKKGDLRLIGHASTIFKPNSGSFKKGMSGELSPAWKGGITSFNKLLRKSSLYKIWRELVFLRDNFTCKNPNCEFCNNKMGVFLHPHHIKSFAKYPELRFVISNGITYCKEFHINSKILHKGILKEINYGK